MLYAHNSNKNRNNNEHIIIIMNNNNEQQGLLQGNKWNDGFDNIKWLDEWNDFDV